MLPPEMSEFRFKASKNAHTSLQHLKTPLSATLLVVCLRLQPVDTGIVGYSIASETGNDTPLSYHDNSSGWTSLPQQIVINTSNCEPGHSNKPSHHSPDLHIMQFYMPKPCAYDSYHLGFSKCTPKAKYFPAIKLQLA